MTHDNCGLKLRGWKHSGQIGFRSNRNYGFLSPRFLTLFKEWYGEKNGDRMVFDICIFQTVIEKLGNLFGEFQMLII